METISLILGPLLGLALGAVAAWFVLRARSGSAAAESRAEAERARSDAAQARSEVAQIRADALGQRYEVAQAENHVADSRVQVAEARRTAAEAQAEAAAVASRLAGAVAEREAAIARARELGADRETLINQFKVLSAETLERQGQAVDKTAEERLKATADVVAPVAQALQLFQQRLTEVEKDRVAMSTELSEQVRTVRLTGEELRRETAGLATALRKPQVRGAWGETQLKRVAEITGMVERCDFDLQVTTRSDDRTIRPDMRVNLADGKFVFVDSKVPLTAFLEAAESTDEQVQARHLAQFARLVRTHIDQLSSKQYWRADSSTPEFVILFLPSEAFLAAALEQSGDLHEYAAARDVVLATPAILIAVLRSVHYGWKQAALAESAAEVFQIGRELYDRLGTMGGHFDKLGRQLNSSVKAYNSAISSMESRVMVSARRFRDLKVADADLAQIGPAEEVARPLTTTELVEDATQVAPMIGRAPTRRRGPAVNPATDANAAPEAAELVRPDPELDDLFSTEEPAPRGHRDVS